MTSRHCKNFITADTADTSTFCLFRKYERERERERERSKRNTRSYEEGQAARLNRERQLTPTIEARRFTHSNNERGHFEFTRTYKHEEAHFAPRVANELRPSIREKSPPVRKVIG
jgi:arginyl-tRNA--protein-N-Asp/Glu arginylyltransferase